MKELYYYYLLGIAAAVTIFASCSNFEDYRYSGSGTERSENNGFLKDSKGLFEMIISHTPYINHSRSAKTGNVDNLTPGVFSPKWESAYVNKKSSILSANVPITTEFKYLAKVEEFKNGKKHIYTLPMPQKLVVVQDVATGRMNCYIMTLIPSKECTDRFKKNLDGMFFNSNVNEKFSGTVIYSSIAYNYKIVRVDRYVKGRKVQAASMFDDGPYAVFEAKMKQMIGKLRIGRGEASLKTRGGSNEGWEMIAGEWKWANGSDLIDCRDCQPCNTHPGILKRCSQHGGNGTCSECKGGSCRCVTCGCEEGFQCSMTTCAHDLGEVVVTPCNECDRCDIHQFDIYCLECAEREDVFYYGYCPGCQTGPDPDPDPVPGEETGGGGEDPEGCPCPRTRSTDDCGCGKGSSCKCNKGDVYLKIPVLSNLHDYIYFGVYPTTVTHIQIFARRGNNEFKKLDTSGGLSAYAMSPGTWDFYVTAREKFGSEIRSGIESTMVMLPSGLKISARVDFWEIVNQLWTKTLTSLNDGKPGGVLQEFGCWLYYWPNDDRITSGKFDAGNSVSLAYESKVGIIPYPRDSNINTNDLGDGSGMYAVGYVHTHTPMTYVTGPFYRMTGPGTDDKNNEVTSNFPCFVYDYLKNRIDVGHFIGEPMIITVFGSPIANPDAH